MMCLYQVYVNLITSSIDQLVISSYAFAIKISFKINILTLFIIPVVNQGYKINHVGAVYKILIEDIKKSTTLFLFYKSFQFLKKTFGNILIHTKSVIKQPPNHNLNSIFNLKLAEHIKQQKFLSSWWYHIPLWWPQHTHLHVALCQSVGTI